MKKSFSIVCTLTILLFASASCDNGQTPAVSTTENVTIIDDHSQLSSRLVSGSSHKLLSARKRVATTTAPAISADALPLKDALPTGTMVLPLQKVRHTTSTSHGLVPSAKIGLAKAASTSTSQPTLHSLAHGHQRIGHLSYYFGCLWSIRCGCAQAGWILGHRTWIGRRYHAENTQSGLQSLFRRKCHLHDQCTCEMERTLQTTQKMEQITRAFPIA